MQLINSASFHAIGGTTDTSSDSFNSQQTVGVIVGIATIATATVILVLYALMLCKYCFYKHSRKQLRTTTGYDVSSASGNFTQEYSHKGPFEMSPRYTARQDSGVS